MLLASLIALSTFSYASYSLSTQVLAEQNERKQRDPHPNWQAGDHLKSKRFKKLPTFTRKEVLEHNTENSLWLTYRHGVYDLTAFAYEHPGAIERLLLACKGNHDICSWWEQLGYHNVTDVHNLLENFRIGNIDAKDYIECGIKDADIDPILRESRAPLNDTAFSYEPFIAETPIEFLNESFYTPSKYHYVRNHYPVPLHLDWDSTFTISGIGIPQQIKMDIDDEDEEIEGYELKYKDILSLPSITKDIYLQCGGHRRIEYKQFGVTKGSKWNVGAIGNGRYKGVLLRDVLKYIGVDVDGLYNNGNNDYHVWFIGADAAPDGEQYGVSIPLYKALDPRGDVMLAYEYNGESLTPDHGYPVRMVVPGWVGARSVKWIEQIIIMDKPCDMKSYTKSYRMTKGFKYEMRELPVNSAIHSPLDGDIIKVDELKNNKLHINGEAHSGDGRPIIRVDVSIDGGKTWNKADILGEEHLNEKKWSWTKWECDIDVSELRKKNGGGNELELNIVCRAMDISHNRQPSSCEPDLTFNPKGYGANSYHRINVIVSDGIIDYP